VARACSHVYFHPPPRDESLTNNCVRRPSVLGAGFSSGRYSWFWISTAAMVERQKTTELSLAAVINNRTSFITKVYIRCTHTMYSRTDIRTTQIFDSRSTHIDIEMDAHTIVKDSSNVRKPYFLCTRVGICNYTYNIVW